MYTAPEAARHALQWRGSTLPQALERAAQLGLSGAAFPWRTITGAECSGYWPAGTAAFHVGADIANAVTRYVHATDDDVFDRETGLALLVETARMWRSLGHYDTSHRFRLDGVTGPDEYSAIADNNSYTVLMAQHNFRAAADATRRHPDEARDLGVDDQEVQT
jgi:alpha,alpha-trehalose phosphorylase